MKRFWNRFAAVLTLLAVLALCLLPAACADGLAAVFNAKGKIYVRASSHSKYVKVQKETEVEVVAVNGDWAQVEYAGNTGYCKVKLLTLTNRIHVYAVEDTKIYRSARRSSHYTRVGKGDDFYVVGRNGKYYRIENKAGDSLGYIRIDSVSEKKPSSAHSDKAESATDSRIDRIKRDMVLMDWFEGGEKVLKKGGKAELYDIQSGSFIQVKRKGGTNNAVMEPLTKEDTALLKAAGGGKFSWNSRPAILIVGYTCVACAINTMPEGEESIRDNDFPGCFSLHMVNSRTHETNKVNEKHQKAIQKAYEWAQK